MGEHWTVFVTYPNRDPVARDLDPQQLHALREALELYDDQYLLVNHRRHQHEFVLLEEPGAQARRLD